MWSILSVFEMRTVQTNQVLQSRSPKDGLEATQASMHNCVKYLIAESKKFRVRVEVPILLEVEKKGQ